jgi:hypothetical protein
MNEIIVKQQGALFSTRGARVYLHRCHWRYLDAEDGAKIFLGCSILPNNLHARRSNRSGDKVYYLHEKLK